MKDSKTGHIWEWALMGRGKVNREGEGGKIW
jgi:hypothetical protein